MNIKINTSAVIGLDHIKMGKECQDHAAGQKGRHCSVISVSDGRSSAPHAVKGAFLSVKTAISALSDEKMWKQFISQDALKNHLMQCFKSSFSSFKSFMSSDKLSQYDATCAAAAVTDNGDYILFSVGDSILVTFDTALHPTIAVWPTKLGNTTYFTSMAASSDRSEELRFSMQVRRGNMEKEQIAGFALLTDGAEYFLACPPDGTDRLRKSAAECTVREEASGQAALTQALKHIAEETRFGKIRRDDAAAAFLMNVTDQSIAAARKILDPVPEQKAPVPLPVQKPVPEQPDGITLPAQFAKAAPAYWGVLYELQKRGAMTARELSQHALPSGTVIYTMYDLVYNKKLVQFQDGKFSLIQK